MKVTRLLFFCFLLGALSSARATLYFQDFSSYPDGTTNFSDGAQLFSTALGTAAEVADDTLRELQLTSGLTSVRSAFMLPDLDPGQAINAFSAKFSTPVYGAFPNAADGFSFNFGSLSGLNLTNSTYSQESGFGTGLTFSVQTYTGNSPGFYLRLNGATIASQSFDPSTRWGTNTDQRHYFEIDWVSYLGLTVRMDGQTLFDHVQSTNFTAHSGDRFVWAARCGAYTEYIRVDNIAVYTGGNFVDVTPGTTYYSSSGIGAKDAFDGLNSTEWEGLGVAPAYIGATFTPSNPVVAYSITTADISSRASDPKIWSFQGSNDGNTWTQCGADSGLFASRTETRCFPATNGNVFSAYRLYISNVVTASSAANVAELRAYSVKDYSTKAWVQSSAPTSYWMSMALSSDGLKMIAADGGSGNGHIYTSKDYGTTWTQTAAPLTLWHSVALASDGKRMAAATYYNGIWISRDGGANWTKTSAPSSSSYGYNAIAVATGDFNSLAAVTYDQGIWGSTDGGTNWSQVHNTSSFYSSVALNATGAYLAAGIGSGPIDEAANFTGWGSWGSRREWSGTAICFDGSVWYASSDGGIFKANGFTATWNQTSAPNAYWSGIACSGNGGTVLSGSYGGGLLVSTDSGTTWTRPDAPDQNWNAFGVSYDGSRQAASVSGGGIWVLNTVNPLAPAATTGSATPAVGTSLLQGSGVANYLDTTVWFQYGPTATYGNTTTTQSIGHGVSSVGFSIRATGLTPGSSYHYRAVASNALGVVYGTDASFTTLSTNYSFDLTEPGNTLAASSTNSPSTEGVTGAIDNTIATKYLNFDELNTGLKISPSVTNLPVQALTLVSPMDAPERDPASYVLRGSLDGVNFVNIVSNAVPAFGSRAIQSFRFANTNRYSTYQLLFPTVQNSVTANSMQVAEVELLPFGEITSPADQVTFDTSNGRFFSSGSAAALVDRNVRSTSDDIQIANPTPNVTAIIVPAAGKSIAKGIEIIGGADDASFPDRAPTTLALDGSNDGTNFTTLLSPVNLTVPGVNLQIQQFSFMGNTNSYNQYRVTFGPPRSGLTLQFSELRLFGQSTAALSAIRSGTNILVTWPVTGFALQQNTNLTTANWRAVTNAITITNGLNQVTLPRAATNNTFRLQTF